jgi:hypothetical protein
METGQTFFIWNTTQYIIYQIACIAIVCHLKEVISKQNKVQIHGFGLFMFIRELIYIYYFIDTDKGQKWIEIDSDNKP